MTESLNDKLEAFFKDRPNVSVDGKRLAEIAGGYAWRTRVSDLRTKRGMNIVNDVITLKDASGKPYKISHYTFLPELPVRLEADGQQAFI
jgi:hypothetical protein